MRDKPVPLCVGLYVETAPTSVYRRVDDAARVANVAVCYERGIMRADYGEWLAGKFLTGDEPDVFLLPPEDFIMYAKIGALKELSMARDDKRSQNLSAYGEYKGKVYAVFYKDNLIAVSARTSHADLAEKFVAAVLSDGARQN